MTLIQDPLNEKMNMVGIISLNSTFPYLGFAVTVPGSMVAIRGYCRLDSERVGCNYSIVLLTGASGDSETFPHKTRAESC